MKQYLKPILILVGIILIASVLSKVINNSETLLEYAERTKTSAPIEVSNESNTEVSIYEEADTTSAESYTESENSASYETADNSAQEDVTLSFYYEPLSEELINKITGISYIENENIKLSCFCDISIFLSK